VGDVLYVDGGLISNFPLWVFESELSTFDARPMLGFRFMDDWKLGTTLNLGNYSRLLAAAVFEGDMFLHARSTGNVHLVPLKTEVGTIDFDLDREAKQRAFEAGRDATREALWHIALRPAMAAALAGLAEWLAGRPGLALGRLRINVAVPESLGPLDGADGRGLILRLRFGHNMKGEPDYVLSFKPGVGGTGLCWQNNRAASQPSCVVFGRPQIEAIPDPMKRLVNADVKTLISVPVRQDQFLIGVCTFDCTADCQRELADPALQRDLIAEVSRRIAAVLARRPARMTPMVMPAVAAARLTPAAAAAPSPEQSTPHVS
jgi:hypothetical protein